MSSFILPTQGFVMLANELAVYAEDSSKESDAEHWIAAKVREYLGWTSDCFHTPTDAHPQASLRAQELHAANVAAFNGRYEDNDEIPTEREQNPSFIRLTYWPQWTPIQFYKSLACLRYQLAEDPVFETPVYKELDRLITEIAIILVDELPEYRSADWGFPVVNAALKGRDEVIA